VLSLADLTTRLSVDDVKRSIYSVLAATGVTTTAWKPGAVVRTLIAAVAIVVASLSQLVALLAQSAFLSTSTGDWLGQVARNVYNVERLPATFATTTVTLTNTGGGVYDFDPGDLQVLNPTTHQAYFNVAAVTIGSGATVEGVIVQAYTAGAAGTSYVGEISQFQTAGLTSVSVTNPLAAIGTDAEDDPSVRQRCLDKLGSLSPNGPSDAYAYVARSATDSNGSPLGITRVKVENDGYGRVTVTLATADGHVPGTIGDTATALGKVDDDMQRLAAPLAVTLDTESATPKPVDVTYTLWLYNTSGLTSDQIQQVIKENLTTFVTSQPIGGNLIGTNSGRIYHSAIETAVGSAATAEGAPLTAMRVEIAAPAGDFLLASNEAPTIGTVSGQVIPLKPPGL
jgi:phage-related baseplate assembly protein